MPREPYPCTPMDCPHQGLPQAHLAGELLFLVCPGCGSVRKAWGRPVTAANLAATGLGHLRLTEVMGGAA